MVWRIFGIGPVVLIWLGMLYDFALNLSHSFSVEKSATQALRLGTAPDVVFSWLQVLVHGSMIIVMSFAFLILIQLNRAVKTATPWPLTTERVMGLALVLAFSMITWVLWFWALSDLFHGHKVISLGNLRYFVETLLLPYPAWLCLRCLFVRQQQQRQAAKASMPTDEMS